ncbi:MAG: hypothetical protein R3F31_11550 [Verrucomicrobiales bacterium]
MLRPWLPYCEALRTLPAGVREGARHRAAQIDRVLAPRKVGAGVVCRLDAEANAAIKALVPVRAEVLGRAGARLDRGGHRRPCGGDMGGSFL